MLYCVVWSGIIVDKNKGKRNKDIDDESAVSKMATASFTKEFAIRDKSMARKVIEKINSNDSTIKVSSSGVNISESFARSEELLKKFLSR